jgi:crotonobetainyl-CoA:carnitine CoA-transferase CaiB-like acyl-CoA transferase
LQEEDDRNRFYELVSGADIHFNNHRPGWLSIDGRPAS